MRLETPPRAWGRRSSFSTFAASSGNTPTCVGKTPPRLGPQGQRGKHPHVRGEDTAPLAMAAPVAETPPRAWGRPPEFKTWWGWDGNTPTCVGKTSRTSSHAKPVKKHPHVRGEDAGCLNRLGYVIETPPRAWGRRLAAALGPGWARNTPTCVGKTEGGHEAQGF